MIYLLGKKSTEEENKISLTDWVVRDLIILSFRWSLHKPNSQGSMKLPVAGRSQSWLRVRTVSLTCFPLLLLLIIIHNGLPQSILPLCLTAKPKCLCLGSCPPVDGRKEEMNTPPGLRLAILGDICKINGLFTLFPHFPPLWSIKEPDIQTQVR